MKDLQDLKDFDDGPVTELGDAGAISVKRVCAARGSRPQLERFNGLSRKIQNLALTVVHVPTSLDSGLTPCACLQILRLPKRVSPDAATGFARLATWSHSFPQPFSLSFSLSLSIYISLSLCISFLPPPTLPPPLSLSVSLSPSFSLPPSLSFALSLSLARFSQPCVCRRERQDCRESSL